MLGSVFGNFGAFYLEFQRLQPEVTDNMKQQERQQFRFSLGDTSNDGHEITQTFYLSIARQPGRKTMQAMVSAAWDAAEKKLPKQISPLNFCREYGSNQLPKMVAQELIERGCPVPKNWQDWPMEPDDMAKIVVWYLNQGNPNLDAKLEFPQKPAYLILPDNIGYGLFDVD